MFSKNIFVRFSLCECVYYPVSSNFCYMWNFGVYALVCFGAVGYIFFSNALCNQNKL